MVPSSQQPVFHISFVCTGNICRSPMAEAIMTQLVATRGLAGSIHITSSGTGEWHVGEKADPRTRAALDRAGYSADTHRAKQFVPDAFDQCDLIVTFDRGQRRILRAWAENEAHRALIRPLLSFDPRPDGQTEVPDPYYGDEELFDCVLELIEHACTKLLDQIEPAVRAARGETAR